MQTTHRKQLTFLATLFSLVFLWTCPGSAQDYPALQGVDSVQVIFDVRSGDLVNVFEHLKLTHETYNDQAVRNVDDQPDFAVVFMGQSVTLLPQNQEGFTDSEKEMLTQMNDLLASMDKEGVKLEVCEEALHYFEVDAQSIDSKFNKVPNGWISSIGYQARGYSLVPIY